MDSASISESSLTKKSSVKDGAGPVAGQPSKLVYRSYSAADRAAFFTALDRENTISVAAAAVGINRATGYYWAYSSGLVQPAPRKKSALTEPASDQEKAEFFKVLAQVGSVSVAARAVGIPRSRCAAWARAAGIKSIHPGVAKRAEFLRLREAGTGKKQAAAAVGASHTSAAKWENAWDIANGRAVAPEPPKLPYKRGVTSSKTQTAPLQAGTGRAPSPAPASPVPDPAAGPTQAEQDREDAKELAVLEQPISSRYLSLAERLLIADLLRRQDSMRSIARELGRNVGTISREIKRNSHPGQGYLPNIAHRASVKARGRHKELKLIPGGELWCQVQDGLRIRWSPEQISNTLIKDFPDEQHMRVSTETIYKTLYLQAKSGLAPEIKLALRTGRARRKPHQDPLQRTPRFRDEMINISQRPPEVEDRAVPGHYEGDLITGTQNKSAIGTIVERTTRYVMLVHLPIDHTAESVRDGLIKTMSTLPTHLRGSLTWDQGSEMAKHKGFTMATDMDVYFCDPASPWQRGSNENTNGLLRQYFPKGTDLNAYSAEDLEYVAQELNGRPRKSLGWKTPAEAFRDLLIPS